MKNNIEYTDDSVIIHNPEELSEEEFMEIAMSVFFAPILESTGFVRDLTNEEQDMLLMSTPKGDA